METPNHYYYKDHAEKCDPEDFWGQVKRTVGGKPIDQYQIDLIVEAVINGMDLQGADTLLDLCCGNGALTTYLFSRCKGGLGVDLSEYLIKMAQKNFVKRQAERFVMCNVVDYARDEPSPEQFNKALCYGSLQYLGKDDAEALLLLLRQRFLNLKKVFVGNVPDKNRLRAFYSEADYQQGIEDVASSPIGIWRTEQEFNELGDRTGWNVQVRRMPDAYYSAHYRYDAILTPA